MPRDITESTIEEDAEIDRFDLVGEMEIQPGLFRKWSALLVEAQEERDDWKTKRDLHAADLDDSIRTEPEEYGIERVTETAIKNIVLQDETYQRLQKKRLAAERKINAYVGAIRTMEHRKRMLEKMADLWEAGYFSENMTARTSKTRKKSADATSSKIRRSLNRSTRGKRRSTNAEESEA